MTGRLARRLVYAAVPVLYLLHNDLWLWDDPRRLFGLPVGLLYHVGLCVAASVLMLLLVRRAWPSHLEVRDRAGEDPGEDR